MIIQCSKCQKKYKIDSEKVTEKGVKVTCQNCGNVLLVRKRPEDTTKEVIPCSVCGHTATKALDTDAPLCDRCYEIDHEKAARFVEFNKPKSGGASHERELDLSSSKDVSFDSISGGDFSPSAYSTGVLPGEGRGYVPPEREPMKSVVGDSDDVNFEEFGHNQDATATSPYSSGQQETKTPPVSPKPPPTQKPPASTPPPGVKPSGTPPGATPPPRSATPPPGYAGKPGFRGAGVKDATPPPVPSTLKPKPARPSEPTPPPMPGSGKKIPPKSESVTLEPVEESDAEALSMESIAEVTSLDVPQEQETPKRASILPLILSVLLLLTLALYFFIKFMGMGSP